MEIRLDLLYDVTVGVVLINKYKSLMLSKTLYLFMIFIGLFLTSFVLGMIIKCETGWRT